MLHTGECAHRRARPPIYSHSDALEVIRDAATAIESHLHRLDPRGRLHPIAVEMVHDLRESVAFLEREPEAMA